MHLADSKLPSRAASFVEISMDSRKLASFIVFNAASDMATASTDLAMLTASCSVRVA